MTTRRTRTPSDLKFMLNDRAVLCGLLQSGSRDCRALQSELVKLQDRTRTLQAQIAAIDSQKEKWRAEIADIDEVLQASHPGCKPDAAGAVTARAGKYGRHGELKAFIHSMLQASPAGVRVRSLVEAAAACFHLTLPTTDARARMRRVISKQLHRPMDAGLAHSAPVKEGSRAVLSFWNSAAPGDELLRIARGAPCDQVTNAVRGEVGG